MFFLPNFARIFLAKGEKVKYFEFFIEECGWLGAVLAALLLILFGVQVYCYAVRYVRLSKYRNSQRSRRLETETPPVSVILPLFNESIDFIERGLVRLLAQDYDSYEVVVVYVGRDDDFYYELSHLSESFPNLRTTKIPIRPKYPISPKMAVNIGIKAASNEHIILTTADASPRTSRWLALMAKGFARGEVVLGYCCTEQLDTIFGRLIRIDRMMQSAEWLSSAVEGRPYRGHRCNFGFTRTQYFEANGFGNLNMVVGEDDLFVQSIIRDDNVSIVLSPRATVVERSTGGLVQWMKSRRFFGSTRRLYPFSVRCRIHLEPYSRLLFFVTAAAAFATMPMEYCAAVGFLLVLRYIIVGMSVSKLASRLGERHIAAVYPVYDLFGVLFEVATDLMLLRKDPSVWRYTSIS